MGAVHFQFIGGVFMFSSHMKFSGEVKYNPFYKEIYSYICSQIQTLLITSKFQDEVKQFPIHLY